MVAISGYTKTGAQALFLAPDPALRGVKFALDAGRSVALGWTGDSTSNYDGTNPLNPADLRTPVRVAQLLAAKYPAYHVLARHWDAGNSRLGPALAVQTAAAGQRYGNFTGRSVRWRPTDYTTTRFTSGNLDLRVLYVPSEGWTTGAGLRMLASRRLKDVDGTNTSAREQFQWGLNSDGRMRFDYSTNGTSLDQQNMFSTAAVSLTNGTPTWLRMTAEFVVGASRTLNFYTSADGITWTQVGNSVVFNSSTIAAMFDAYDGFFTVGAAQWQPASNPANGKIYELQIRDGVNGPIVAPCLPELWEQYGDGTVTFGGAPTLYLINTSISGSKMSAHNSAAQVAMETPNFGQAVQVFNNSHNEAAFSGPQWTAAYAAWVQAVQTRLPRAKPVICLQNPHTSAWANEASYGQAHPVRLEEARDMAVANGWGAADLFSAFTSDPRGLSTLIQSDGLHPTQAGYDLAARTIVRRMGIAA